MVYVDGYVIPIPKENIEMYKSIASDAGKIWMKHGALRYIECIGDDLTPDLPGMSLRSFMDAANATEHETVAFSFIIYNSREHRDEVNKKVMEDPDMKEPEFVPFATEKMLFGGFTSIVDY